MKNKQRKAILFARTAFACPVVAVVIYLVCQVFIQTAGEGQHVGIVSVGDPINLMLSGWVGSAFGLAFARESSWIDNRLWSIGNLAFYGNVMMFFVFAAIASALSTTCSSGWHEHSHY